TVTYCALQLAFHLGVEEVILLGVDHSFSHSGRAHRAERASGGDVNHFDPNYFGKGVVWQYPDLLDSEINYATAREVFRIHGRTIKDATVGGKLSVFERISGYAANPEDDVPTVASDRDGQPALVDNENLDRKGRLYAKFLNNSSQRLVKAVGATAALAGLALLGWMALEAPAIMIAVLGTLLMLGGLCLCLSSLVA